MCFKPCFMALTLLVAAAVSGRADVIRWDNGQLIPGTEGIAPGPGVQLDHCQLEYAGLYRRNLGRANFSFFNGADTAGLELRRALR